MFAPALVEAASTRAGEESKRSPKILLALALVGTASTRAGEASKRLVIIFALALVGAASTRARETEYWRILIDGLLKSRSEKSLSLDIHVLGGY